MKSRIAVSVLIVCLLVICSCRKKEVPVSRPTQKKLVVVTTLFPLYDFARTIGGDKADVSLILPPGIEAHTFEPNPDEPEPINFVL